MTNPAIEELEKAAEEFERRLAAATCPDECPCRRTSQDLTAILRSRISQLEQEEGK